MLYRSTLIEQTIARKKEVIACVGEAAYPDFLEMMTRCHNWVTEFSLESGINSSDVRQEIKSILDQTFLGFNKTHKPIKVNVVCDETNNPPSAVEQKVVKLAIGIRSNGLTVLLYFTRYNCTSLSTSN